MGLPGSPVVDTLVAVQRHVHLYRGQHYPGIVGALEKHDIILDLVTSF